MKGETSGERARRLRQERREAGIGRPDAPVRVGGGDGATEPDDPWANFDAHPEAWGNAGPPPADLVAPRGTKQWRQAMERRRRWEGDQIHTNAALTGLDIGKPGQLERLLEMSGIWKYHPDDPNRLSHKWKYWTGGLGEEPGGGMVNIGNTPVPFSTQRYMPDWKWERDYAVQGGHLIKGAPGEYISPRGDGTAVVQDQFNNPIRIIKWPPDGQQQTPGTPTHPDVLSATGTPAPAPAGMGMSPQQTQQLTNSMAAGFGIPAVTPTTGATPAPVSTEKPKTEPPPSTETTITTKQTGTSTSPTSLTQQQPQPNQNSWYSSGFGI